MRWNVYIKSLCSGMLLSGLVLTGCSSGKLAQTETPVEEASPLSPSAEAEISSFESDDLDLDALVQEAERHYAKGCEHYNAGDWALAEQEFDRALETLLDADVDAETHYRLGKAYNTLFYNIHKFALKQSYLSQTHQEPVQEPEEASLEALPRDITVDVEPPSADVAPQYPTDTLGEVVIDQSDADILKYIKQFSHEKSQYRRGIERSGKYLSMIRQVFSEYKLPEQLIYIPIIESNFRVDAVSPAGAVGMWQFVRTTAKVYGLKVDKWVDPEKSTVAAAKYLRDLYDMLGDWDLAMSGYYMGEYKVHKAIGQYRTRDISTLADKKSFGSGAKQYVWRIKAAAFIAMNPEQHDLDVEPSSPLRYDTINVAKGKRLSDLARQLGVSSKQLKELNPELKTSTIPPGNGQYTLKVPVGAGQIMLAEQVSSPTSSTSTSSPSANIVNSDEYVIHSVRRGETLAKIARRYGVNALMLQSFNNIHDARALQIGLNATTHRKFGKEQARAAVS